MTPERIIPILRPARQSDTPDMLELTRTIWEGDDYVPLVWARWLADPQGLLAVAEYAGHVVGLAKLTRLSEADWWFEGLRTNPELEGRGIASALHDYLLQAWEETGSGTVRLSTASFRLAVHHLCARTGFEKVAEFTPFHAPALDEPAAGFTPITPDEIPAALELIRGSPALGLLSDLFDLGWHWAAPAEAYLQPLVEHGMAWWWRDRTGLLAAWEEEDDEERGRVPFIASLACPVEALAEFLLDFRRQASALGCRFAAWNAPLLAGLEPVLNAAGFTRSWDASIYVFAKSRA